LLEDREIADKLSSIERILNGEECNGPHFLDHQLSYFSVIVSASKQKEILR
jgi:hypothetical protein